MARSGAADRVGFLIPADRIARVIGKAGTGLKQVREHAQCKVTVHQQADAVGTVRRVDVTGNAEQICTAFAVTLQRAFEDAPVVTVALLVPADKAGLIVGKSGENLRRVREQIGVKVQLEREPVVDPNSMTKERLLTMQGELRHLSAALGFCLGSSCSPLPAVTRIPPPGHDFAPARKAHSTGDDANEIHVRLVVPDKAVGHVLGRGGVQVKQTAATTGCSISMSSKESGHPRLAQMTGSYSQCKAAQALIYEQIVSLLQEDGVDTAEVTALYMIPKEFAGAIIGKQGAGLKQIREQSGVKVQVDREEVNGHRVCTITGAINGVLMAEKAIHDMSVDEAEAHMPHDSFVAAPVQQPLQSKRHEHPIQTSLLSAKRQRMEENGAMTRMLIPSAAVGAVIGKQGSGLRVIRETHGVKVDMMTHAQNPHFLQDRVMCLVGPLTCRQGAIAGVLRAVSQGEDVGTLKMLVPSPMAGAVIGKAGQTLRTIREQTGVSVQVERDDLRGERLVTATGPLAQVSNAAAMVVGLADESSGADGAPGDCSRLDLAAAAPEEANEQPFAIGARLGSGEA